MWKWIKAVFSRKEKPPMINVPSPRYDGTDHMIRGSLKWYGSLWDSCIVRQEPLHIQRTQAAVDRLMKNSARYKEVQLQTKVPWWVIGCIHLMEASGNFDGVLHNGELIVGTSKRTTLVPKWRGPFATWEESAVDALGLMELPKTWSIESALMFLEKYNGTGYLKYHPEVKSPYLWSGTMHYTQGKYVADGKFDKNAVSKHSGCAAVIMHARIPVSREQYT
jgi:lysozyme family protein